MAWTGQVKDLDDVKGFAKTLLDEGANSFWTDAQQTALANEANRMVFRILVDNNPEFFLEKNTTANDNAFTWPKDTERVQLDHSSFLGSSVMPYKVVGVENVATNAAITPSNLPTKWRPMRFSERHLIERGGPDIAHHYCVVRNYMYISPIPQQDLYFYVYWIPPLGEMSSAAHFVLSEDVSSLKFVAEAFGDCVGYALAHLMNAKQNNANPAVEQLWNECIVRMTEHSQLRHVDEPMKVTITRAPWE
jgi:hypothetical protein